MFENWRKYEQERRERNERFWGSIPPGCWHSLVIALGILGILAALPPLWNFATSFYWTETTGQILRSEVIEEEHVQNGRYETTYRYSYHPLIEYRYQMNGRVHTSRQRYFDVGLLCWEGECLIKPRQSESPLSPNEVTARYPVNSRVTVYVNPNNPTQAVLERKASTVVYVALGLGLFLTLGGIGLLAWWLGSLQKKAVPDALILDDTVYHRKKRIKLK